MFNIHCSYCWNFLFWFINCSTSKLEEINFPFHPLHCKPSLANILYGQISVSEWRHSKANLGPDEKTLWIGGRKSWAAPASCMKWPAAQASESFHFIFLSAKPPHVHLNLHEPYWFMHCGTSFWFRVCVYPRSYLTLKDMGKELVSRICLHNFNLNSYLKS